MRNIVLGTVSVGPNRMSNKQGSHVEMNVDCCILLVPRETAQNIYMRNIVLGPVSVGPNRMSNKQGSHIEINVDCILVPKESTQKIYTNILLWHGSQPNLQETRFAHRKSTLTAYWYQPGPHNEQTSCFIGVALLLVHSSTVVAFLLAWLTLEGDSAPQI